MPLNLLQYDNERFRARVKNLRRPLWLFKTWANGNSCIRITNPSIAVRDCKSRTVGPSKLDQLIYQLNHTQKKSAALWYQESIEVYPNPAHRELNVKGKQLHHFQLTDILGIPVFSSSLNEKQETHSFQLPELKKGVYLYSIETPTGMQSGKLLIE